MILTIILILGSLIAYEGFGGVVFRLFYEPKMEWETELRVACFLAWPLVLVGLPFLRLLLLVFNGPRPSKKVIWIVVDDPGDRKMHVIKIIREGIGMLLKEAKEASEGEPFLHPHPSDCARVLRDAGATVSLVSIRESIL